MLFFCITAAISSSTWFHLLLFLRRRQNLEVKLREQYLERNPKRNPFGTDVHPRLWGELGLSQKVSLVRLTNLLALPADAAPRLSLCRSTHFIWSVNGSGRILKGSGLF
jgi:hypothetical protein